MNPGPSRCGGRQPLLYERERNERCIRDRADVVDANLYYMREREMRDV